MKCWKKGGTQSSVLAPSSASTNWSSCETFYNKASSSSSTEFQTSCNVRTLHRFSIPRSVSSISRCVLRHGMEQIRTVRVTTRVCAQTAFGIRTLSFSREKFCTRSLLFENDWRPVLSINTVIFWLAGAARVSSFERRAAFSPSPACATAAFRRAQPGVSREQARDGRVLQQSRAVQHTGPARAVVAYGTCLRSGSSCDRPRRHLSFLRLTRTRLVLSLSLSLFLARVVSCRRAGPPNTARRDVVRARDSVPRGARRPAEPHRPV